MASAINAKSASAGISTVSALFTSIATCSSLEWVGLISGFSVDAGAFDANLADTRVAAVSSRSAGNATLLARNGAYKHESSNSKS